MKSWIRVVLAHPRYTLLLIALVTLFFVAGVAQLKMDASLEALMPEADPSYVMLRRAREIYGNKKSIMIMAVEKQDSSAITDGELFSVIIPLVNEIKEFQSGDSVRDQERLNRIAELAGMEQPKKTVATSSERADREAQKSDDAQLDAMMLGSNGDLSVTQISGDHAAMNLAVNGVDLWDISDDSHLVPREKEDLHFHSQYAIKAYRPVSIRQIALQLDPASVAMLSSIAAEILPGKNEEQALTEGEFLSLFQEMEFLNSLKDQEILKQILDPVFGEDVNATVNRLESVKLMTKSEREKGGRLNAEAWQRYLLRISLNPQNNNLIFSKNARGEISAFGVTILFKNLHDYSGITRYIRGMVKKYNKEGKVHISLAGDNLMDLVLNEVSQRDTGNFLSLALLTVIATFFLNFRSWIVTAVLTLSIVLGVVWTMGAMGWMGIPLTMTATILPPILVAVGSSYGIHIYNQYYLDSIHGQKLSGERLAASLFRIAPTVVLAGATTLLGFLMLGFTKVSAVREFGLFAALGTGFSVVVAVLLIPAILSVFPIHVQERFSKSGKGTLVDRLVELVGSLVIQRPGMVLIVALVLIAAVGTGIQRLTSDSSPITFFRKDSYIRQNMERVDHLFHGSYTLDIEFDSGTKGGVYNPEFLKKMEAVRSAIESLPDREHLMILNTLSYSDFDKRMHMAMNANSLDYYRIPDQESTIRDYHEIFSGEDDNSDGRPDILDSFVDPSFRRAILTLRIGETPGRSVSTGVAQDIESRLRPILNRELAGTPYSWRTVGLLKSYNELRKYIVYGSVVGLCMALLVVALFILLAFRSYRAALISIIPLGSAMILVYGAMGYLKIPLDTTMAILFSIAIGIGVDDTIHFLKTLRYHLIHREDMEEALLHTYHEAGRAIVFTTMALVLGFSVVTFSNFVPVVRFGLLIMGVMISTTLGALVLLPAVIRLFKVRIEKSFLENSKVFVSVSNFLMNEGGESEQL